MVTSETICLHHSSSWTNYLNLKECVISAQVPKSKFAGSYLPSLVETSAHAITTPLGALLVQSNLTVARMSKSKCFYCYSVAYHILIIYEATPNCNKTGKKEIMCL